jgi:hypothetical protein
MSLKRFILTDPMASWLMGRICGYRSADFLIRNGVLVPANGIQSDYRQRIRRDALDIRRRYQTFHLAK